jgi:hypothetical protein
MPLPKGIKLARFASNPTHSDPGEDWDGLPTKVEPTGYAQGLVPGETVPAETLNFEWHQASLLRFVAEAEAINWSDGLDSARSGLSDVNFACPVYLHAEKTWIGGGALAPAKKLLVSHNGRHWSDQTPGGFSGQLTNMCATGGNSGALEDRVIVFTTNGDLYVRFPDGTPAGEFDGAPYTPAIVAAWGDAASSGGADNNQSVMREPGYAGGAWATFRTAADVPSLMRIRAISPGLVQLDAVDDAETAGLAAYTWSVTEYASLLVWGDRRVVCFVATNAFSVVHNVFRWSDNGPEYLEDWGGSGTNTILLTATHGKVVGLGLNEDESQVIALTSTGRVYITSDLQTWVRRDVNPLDDEERQFFCCVQVGGITYARGYWSRPSTGGGIVEGIFFSLDYGQTWKFEPAPLNGLGDLVQGRRLRGHGDRLTYHAYNITSDISEIAHGMRSGTI